MKLFNCPKPRAPKTDFLPVVCVYVQKWYSLSLLIHLYYGVRLKYMSGLWGVHNFISGIFYYLLFIGYVNYCEMWEDFYWVGKSFNQFVQNGWFIQEQSNCLDLVRAVQNTDSGEKPGNKADVSVQMNFNAHMQHHSYFETIIPKRQRYFGYLKL